MVHCTNCNRILMDKTAEGWKLRSRMVLFSPTGTMALCPSCKTPNAVPVLMGDAPSVEPKPVLTVKAEK